MDKQLVELIISDLKAKSEGIDLFSEDYFFNKKYTKHRSKIDYFGEPYAHRSRLSILIREGMTEIHRTKIFNSDYKLGNMRTLSKELCSYERLADEIHGKARSGHVANDIFKTIQKGIEKITGRKVRDHVNTNASTTFKVIRTLDQIIRLREPRLFQLLRSPATLKQSSMSFRDAYPYEKNQEQVWLLADLKSYLSVELSDEKFNKIGHVYKELDEWLNIVLQQVSQSLHLTYSRDHQSMISAYSKLSKVIEDFHFAIDLNYAALDEVLFTYLNGLELIHFYTSYCETVRVAIPQISVAPISEDLNKLAELIFTHRPNQVQKTDELIQIKAVSVMASRYQKELITIMETAMVKSMDSRKFNQIVEDACNLMRMDCFFGRNNKRPFQDDSAEVSTLYVVAALCCVWHSLDDGTNFKPYWHGQPSQGGSISASNRLDSFLSIISHTETVPEEHRHIWAYRFEWFISALCGQQALIEKKFAFGSAMASAVINICNTTYLENIIRKKYELDGLIRDHLPKTM